MWEPEVVSVARTGQRRLLVGLILVGVVVVLAWSRLPIPSVAEIEAWIIALGPWGPAASIALMIAHSFVPFPAEILAIVNGMVYGPLGGTLLTWSGAMLGAYAAFGTARLLGRPFVERFVAGHNWQHYEVWIAREGWQILLIARFLPVIAFNLVNYAAGLTRIGFWTFTWTTGVGILPMTIIMVVMGDRIGEVPWSVWFASLLVLIAMLFFVRFVVRRRLALPAEEERRDGTL